MYWIIFSSSSSITIIKSSSINNNNFHNFIIEWSYLISLFNAELIIVAIRTFYISLLWTSKENKIIKWSVIGI